MNEGQTETRGERNPREIRRDSADSVCVGKFLRSAISNNFSQGCVYKMVCNFLVEIK